MEKTRDKRNLVRLSQFGAIPRGRRVSFTLFASDFKESRDNQRVDMTNRLSFSQKEPGRNDEREDARS